MVFMVCACFQMDMMMLIFPKEIMVEDAQVDSGPLSCPEEEVNTPEEIRGVFTQVTYSKVIITTTTAGRMK